MSDLTFIEKTKLEKLFAMGGGYVLDFSDRTFAEFVVESTGKEIYDAKYEYASGPKANRLRAFWKAEPNYLVGKLIFDLLEDCRESRPSDGQRACSRSAYALSSGLSKVRWFRKSRRSLQTQAAETSKSSPSLSEKLSSGISRNPDWTGYTLSWSSTLGAATSTASTLIHGNRYIV